MFQQQPEADSQKVRHHGNKPKRKNRITIVFTSFFRMFSYEKTRDEMTPNDHSDFLIIMMILFKERLCVSDLIQGFFIHIIR